MRRRLATFVLAGLALAGGSMPGADAMKKQRSTHTSVMPRPRDGDVAVQEELDAARRAGTIAAYDLFLSRQGDHPLAAVARRERAALRENDR
ncbi:hypothetical protein [Allosphingosinicella sp.]|uniref:hypothetical protein n=1 Tax=Allosphingosinicella sp. TaxID=2823234 RepID=UPI0037852D6A